MITANHQLTLQALDDLNHLKMMCQSVDTHVIALYPNLLRQCRPLSTNLLYYHHNQLVGFLSLFFFYEDACEISVMVAPAFRRQGIATELIQQALPLIHEKRLNTLIFSSPTGVNDSWLPHLGFCYQNSEYQMLRHTNAFLPASHTQLDYRTATLEDCATLCAIDTDCFPKEQHSPSERMHTFLNDPNYHIVLAEENGMPVAKAHILLDDNRGRLSDIAVLPHCQGRGLGKAIMSYCVNFCLSKQRTSIDLDVETNNVNALKLYKNAGFLIANAYDFWSISSHHDFNTRRR